MQAAAELLRANAALIAILAPLAGAGLVMIGPRGRAACFLAMAAALISAGAAGDLAWRVLFLGESAAVAQSGLGLHLDGAGIAAGALSGLAGALVVLASPALTSAGAQTPLRMALLLIALASWMGLAYAGDLAGMAGAATAALLSICALAALGAERDRAALGGAARLLISGGVAIALFIVGAALVERGAGALRLGELASAQPAAPNAAAMGFGLIFAALAMLAGAAPLHGWVGAFYARGAALATIAFGAVGCAALLAALARVAAYAIAMPALGESMSRALLALGLASVVIGSVQAVGARNLARLAAYAAAAQAGCFLIAIAMGSRAGFASGLVQLAALSTAAMALLVGASRAPQPAALDSIDGLARRAPFAGAAVMAGALGLMGAPLTIGFLGRWRLIEAGVGGGWWWAAGAVIVTSLSGVFYGARLIERLYFRRASIPDERAHDPWRIFLAPALGVAFVATMAGVDPAGLLNAMNRAGALLTGLAP